MATIDDVYRKFGEVAEAAQLLETELGNIGFLLDAVEENLIAVKNRAKAGELLKATNRRTLGQAIKHLGTKGTLVEVLPDKLEQALTERNRLAHSFYREHNIRRNTEQGRVVMLKDLEKMHMVIFDAYKAVLLLGGIDLDALVREGKLPDQPDAGIDHLPI
jgi:hypothetical protein